MKGHDYSAPGDYFITICALKMDCVLGEIIDGWMRLSAAGKIACREWRSTETIRPEVTLGPFVIMPNHLHGIIAIHAPKGEPQSKSSAFAKMICLQTELVARPGSSDQYSPTCLKKISPHAPG